MREEMGRRRWPLVATMVLLAVVLALVAAGGRERVQWLVADKLTVLNKSQFQGAVEFDGAVQFDNTADFDGAVDMDSTLDVAGELTLSGGDLVLENDETLSNATDGVITITAAVDITGGWLQYGTSNLYPIGSEDSNFQISWGTDVITANGAINHKVDSPTWASCTISGTLTDNEEMFCSTKINATGVITAYIYKEAGAAGDSGVDVNWLVIGIP